MTTTAEELKATCCVPVEALIARDATLDRTFGDRVEALLLLLRSEQETNLADALELTNNPNAELPFTSVVDWREAYLELAKRNVRQIDEMLFELVGVYAVVMGFLAEPATNTEPPRQRH